MKYNSYSPNFGQSYQELQYCTCDEQDLSLSNSPWAKNKVVIPNRPTVGMANTPTVLEGWRVGDIPKTQARFCDRCGVQLVTECSDCGGHGHPTCPKCQKFKRYVCSVCGGTGEVAILNVIHKYPCFVPTNMRVK